MYIFTYTDVPIHKRRNGVSVSFMFGVCPNCGVGNKLRASCKETRFYFLTQPSFVCVCVILAVVLAHYFKSLILTLFLHSKLIIVFWRPQEASQSTPGVCHLDTLILKVYSRDQPK